jgi:hypothetical protein
MKGYSDHRRRNAPFYYFDLRWYGIRTVHVPIISAGVNLTDRSAPIATHVVNDVTWPT